MIDIFERELTKRLKNQNFFLFGARQTGKTTLIHNWLKTKEKTFLINLLKSEILLKYRTDPSQLRKEIEFDLNQDKKALTVFIDEIQKCPELLDEVHFLMEEFKGSIFFILTGSSARKLKRSGANMLGGRALYKTLHPLTHRELGSQFDLDKVLSGGSLPAIYNLNSEEKMEQLHAYVNIYLKEEIMDEALTRNIPAFSKFLKLAGESSGQIINYSNMSRETGVASKTIKEYYQILEDTLVGFSLMPYLKSVQKALINHPKFYLFDMGVINQLSGKNVNNIPRGGATWGMLFEHFVVLEIKRFMEYHHNNWEMFYWRTRQGHEVDVVLKTGSTLFAIEIKGGSHIEKRDLKGLESFKSEHPDCRPLCVVIAEKPFLLGGIPVIPWQLLFSVEYLEGL